MDARNHYPDLLELAAAERGVLRPGVEATGTPHHQGGWGLDNGAVAIGGRNRSTILRAQAGHRLAILSPRRSAGRRAFSWTVPVTQHHTADRYHLKANLRPRTGWTGLLAAQGSLAEVLSKQHPAAARAYHAGAGARYADPDVCRPVVMAALAWPPRSRGRVRPTSATLPADSPAISVGSVRLAQDGAGYLTRRGTFRSRGCGRTYSVLGTAVGSVVLSWAPTAGRG
jgi:hypothetical protein